MIIELELIRACVAERPEAQKELYVRLFPYLKSTAARYLKDVSFTKDVLQDTFVKIFRSIDQYNPEVAKVEHWAARIAINTAINFNRSNQKHAHQMMVNPAFEPITNPSVYADLTTKEVLIRLKLMPNELYEVFNLFVIDGYNHQTIADTLKIQESLSRKRLSRAREWVKAHLANLDDDEKALTTNQISES